jgi:lactate dehydrogenase-like 2-hydroxyacid dehydrogenase
MKPRVFVTRRWPAAVEEALVDRFDATLNRDDRPLSVGEIAAAFLDHDAVLPTVSDKVAVPDVSGEALRTRIVGNFGVGFNHIDIAGMRRHGVVVTNTPGVLTDCTADIAITLLLMAARRTGEGERQLRAGLWPGWSPTHLIGTKVAGKRLGIIGMGRIGRATARRAHFGFGMEIVFQSRSRLADDELRAMGARQLETIDEVLAISDFVSLHCPGGAENRHLIDGQRLARMKRSAILINTARGDVVDEEALIAALEGGVIAGAGLDVYAGEPRIPERLRALENVVLLPHLGSATEETRVAMGMKVVDNLSAFFAGREPPNRVA